ncbi:MAG: TMEM175 family protein [Candidatus Promineifilaceae bacterium]|jgi:uncharacterized membrane protein
MSETKPSLPNGILSRGVPGNERIIGLSDGVFAIVITLLVLELKVPEVADSELNHALVEVIPKILSHVLSFIVLGIYWVGHHNMFRHIKRHDRILLWLNVLFLLCVATMPFPTGLVVHYADQRISLIIYAAILVAAGLSLDLIWWYVTKNRRLVDDKMKDDFVRSVHRRVLVAPVLYTLAIVLSFVSIILSYLIFVAVILYYVLPLSFDKHHHLHLLGADEASE